MADIQSKQLIVIKGLLFMLLTTASSVGIICYSPSFAVAALVLILVWASARSYYFLFYVLERYVDPNIKYSGLVDLVRYLARSRHQRKLRKLRDELQREGDLDESRRD